MVKGKVLYTCIEVKNRVCCRYKYAKINIQNKKYKTCVAVTVVQQ